jgi:hypothetical protein
LAGMALMVVFFTAQNTARLYREDRIDEEKTARNTIPEMKSAQESIPK